jgi:hypothetical protein
MKKGEAEQTLVKLAETILEHIKRRKGSGKRALHGAADHGMPLEFVGDQQNDNLVKDITRKNLCALEGLRRQLPCFTLPFEPGR